MKDQVTVAIGRKRFSGWESVEVSRGIDALAGTFSLRASPRQPWPVKPGDEVVVWVGRERVVTGYVDRYRSASDGHDGRTIQISGRDRTADLIDCSVDSPSLESIGVSIEDIAEAVIAPFGLRLFRPVPGRALFDTFDFRQGETCFDAIERAARLRGLLVFSDGEGRLRIDEPGFDRASVDLVEGARGNVLSSEVMASRSQRFSTYRVRGQRPGSDEEYPLLVAQAEGVATDPEVRRHRPLVLLAEGPVTDDEARDRAQWEATFRAARSSTVAVRVQGWRQSPAGDLWRPNARVKVRIPSQQVDSELLIQRVTLSKEGADGSKGSTAQLELVRSDAFEPKPEIDPNEDPLRALLDGEEVE